MGEQPRSLDEVRARIDAVDTELLRLLDERAGLAGAVAAAKRAGAPHAALTFGLRSARETQLIRSLLDRPHPNASPALIVRMWRELIGESLKTQGPFSISVFGGRDPARMAELARMRFGGAPPMKFVDSPEAAILAAEALGGVGVIPLDGGAPWAKLLARPKLRVFAVLPCLAEWGRPQALAFAEVEVEPSGWDQTLWVTDAPGSAAVEAALSKLGLAAAPLVEGAGLTLFSLPGYVQSDDARLKQAPGRLTGVLGAAPLPFDL